MERDNTAEKLKQAKKAMETLPEETGGRKDRETKPESNGLDPVRYGDWEANGKCVDF